MSPTFADAVAALRKRHDARSWSALSQAERVKLIHAEMRQIDLDRTKELDRDKSPQGQAQMRDRPEDDLRLGRRRKERLAAPEATTGRSRPWSALSFSPADVPRAITGN